MRLNLGCGSQFIDGWTNVDYSLGARLSRLPIVGKFASELFHTKWDSRIFIHDLTRPFPWKGESIDYVYSSHTLEHLDRATGQFLLCECYRVMKRGAVIRIVVPDLEEIVKRYVTGELPAENFLEELYVLSDISPKSHLKRLVLPYLRFPHQCMYDYASMRRSFEKAGFSFEQREFANSSIPNIEKFEIKERTIGAVVAEGVK